MYLRCIELTNCELMCLYKQPFITHTFSKLLSYKYIVNQFPQGQEFEYFIDWFQ